MPVKLKVGVWGPLVAPGRTAPGPHLRVELEVELERVRGTADLQEQVRSLFGQLRAALGDVLWASLAYETESVPRQQPGGDRSRQNSPPPQGHVP
jgi:hypothetical protein